MPGSVKHGKAEIQWFIFGCKDIHTIIDVGAGSGTYPKLLGDKYTYIGIEIWEPYVKQFNLHEFYEDIIIGDIRNVDLPSGDCIIFGDILEHLSKDHALQVIERALKEYAHVVISIPIGDYPAKEHFGNPHENHISTWKWEELSNLTDWKVTVLTKDIGIFCK